MSVRQMWLKSAFFLFRISVTFVKLTLWSFIWFSVSMSAMLGRKKITTNDRYALQIAICSYQTFRILRSAVRRNQYLQKNMLNSTRLLVLTVWSMPVFAPWIEKVLVVAKETARFCYTHAETHLGCLPPFFFFYQTSSVAREDCPVVVVYPFIFRTINLPVVYAATPLLHSL